MTSRRWLCPCESVVPGGVKGPWRVPCQCWKHFQNLSLRGGNCWKEHMRTLVPDEGNLNLPFMQINDFSLKWALLIIYCLRLPWLVGWFPLLQPLGYIDSHSYETIEPISNELVQHYIIMSLLRGLLTRNFTHSKNANKSRQISAVQIFPHLPKDVHFWDNPQSMRL